MILVDYARRVAMNKLLIAVQSTMIADDLMDLLKDQWDIYICYDCESTKRKLYAIHPDALLIDLGIPEETGFSVLADCFPDLPTSIIAISGLINPNIEQNASRWGVDYLFQIPYNRELLSATLGSIPQLQTVVSKKIVQHLRVLGVTAGNVGYGCLILSILYYNEDFSQYLNKEVYVRVGRQMNMDYRAVERAVRSVIKCAWSNRYNNVWKKYFPEDEYGQVKCPSNKEFIASVAQCI